MCHRCLYCPSMIADLPGVVGDPEPRGAPPVVREPVCCPRCQASLLIVDQAEICLACPYFVLRLDCVTCGATARWRYGAAGRPLWVRLVVGESVICCSAACGVLALNQLASIGRVAVEPQGAGVGSGS